MKPEIVIYENGSLVSNIKFETVPIGVKSIKTITLKNTGDNELKDVKVEVNHPDVKITKQPKFIGVNQEEEVIIEYTPIFETEKGISVEMTIKGVYVV